MPNKDGVWKALVKTLGRIKEKPSTMFPTNWSEQKILDKILEAYVNANYKGIKFVRGAFEITSPTNCGIMLKIVITPAGLLKTAYPLI